MIRLFGRWAMSKAAAGAVAVSLMTGCSIFKDSTQQVKLICPTPGTIVLVDGKRTDCPSTMEMERDKGFTVQAYKDGYIPLTRNVSSHLADSGKWDIFGAILFGVPVLGLLTPGAWDLDTEEVVLTMIDPKVAEVVTPKTAPAPVASTDAEVVRNSQGNRVNPLTGGLIQD